MLQELETPRALGLAELAESENRRLQVRANSRLPAKTQLHLLVIGISDYNADAAAHLQLRFADRDAEELGKKLLKTQTSLYADVHAQRLLNAEATRSFILDALSVTSENMAKGSGNDLAVIYFSGHGFMADDASSLYLLPHDVKAANTQSIKSTALAIGELQRELQQLATHGRVLVLLDACHSGAITMDGTPLAMNATALGALLAADKISVITSSTGTQISYEREDLKHGVFTEALLDAIPAADEDHDGLINATELFRYVDLQVRARTAGAPTPEDSFCATTPPCSPLSRSPNNQCRRADEPFILA